MYQAWDVKDLFGSYCSFVAIHGENPALFSISFKFGEVGSWSQAMFQIVQAGFWNGNKGTFVIWLL